MKIILCVVAGVVIASLIPVAFIFLSIGFGYVLLGVLTTWNKIADIWAGN
jgi:hypothetical protein